MMQGDIAGSGFLKANQELTKPVEPRMAYFYDPATSAVTGNGFFRLDFFTTAPDVRNISPLNYDLLCIASLPS